jgi:hypothetical protein
MKKQLQGQAALSLVILVGGIIVAIGVGLAFIVGTSISASAAYQAGTRAEQVAAAGVSDALLRLVRDRAFAATSGYTMPLDSYQATVTVTQNTPVTGQVTINALARVSGYKRTLQAIAAVDQITGEVTVVQSQLIQ